jgi:hypothetical protein
MEEIIRYGLAGFGLGVLFTFGIVWLFVFRPIEKDNEKRSKGEEK